MSDVGNETVQILVIEDEDDIRNLVVMNLKRAGFDVLSARNGSMGSAYFAHTDRPCLLDLMLPTCRAKNSAPCCARTPRPSVPTS